MSLTIDQNVGLTAFRLFVKNANMDVGQVTVRHLIFSELIVQIRSGKGLEDAREVFKLCFGNTNVNGTGTEYKSPMADGYHKDEFGIPQVDASPRLADLVYEQVKTMELTEENILAACSDLIICGRQYQERTIDAAKTMDKVEIPYGEDMAHVKLNSRENEEGDFDLKCDWKYLNSTEDEQAKMRADTVRNAVVNYSKWKRYKGVIQYVLNTNPSKTTEDIRAGKRIPVCHVADFQNELRINLLERCLDFAADMTEEKQEFKREILSDISTAMRRPEMRAARDIAVFFHDAFRTIQSFRNKSITAANQKYPNRSSALEEHVKGIKKDTKDAISALSNQLRVEFKKLKLSERDYIYVLLNVVFTEGNNAAYAHQVLEEEFFKFALASATEEEAPKYTEDKLIHCDFEEGETVHFELGKAEDEEGRKAYAAIPLEGDFLIKKNSKGKFVAAHEITSLVKIPELQEDKLLFITKPGGGKDNYTCRHMKEITAAMTGKRVTLVPYIKGQDIHDAIVIDGVVIGSFRCSFAVAGQAVNSKALTNMYLYKQGVVEQIIVSNQENSIGEIAVVVLKDVTTVSAPAITGDNTKVKPTAAKPVIKSSNKIPMLVNPFNKQKVTVIIPTVVSEVKPVEQEPKAPRRTVLTPKQFLQFKTVA